MENLLRLVEDWSGVSLYATGSLNSLWYSTWAASEFDEGVFVPPADYRIGWNTQFEGLAPDLSPQGAPPYVPSVYLVDRESCRKSKVRIPPREPRRSFPFARRFCRRAASH